ncbi:ribonuclease III [Leucobacter sp. CX328]|uniref:ribonuclease III n=1 Tax=unclassified Leucobacter TaxID=2621730 RepID=UPI00333FBDD8
MNGKEHSIPGNAKTASHAEGVKPSDSSQSEFGGFLRPFNVDVDPGLLELALTHRSWAFEHDHAPHNERLEFLGDSILGQAVTVKLYNDYPALPEGELAKRRSALVSTVALAEIARGLNLGESLRLGKGEAKSGGRDKDSILADTVEAVIGAVFLSTTPAIANTFVLDLVAPLFADRKRFTKALDPKTLLQQEAAKRGEPHPTYETMGAGPDHDRRFVARVSLGGIRGRGEGTSKKTAELAAARDAVEQLQARAAKRKRR